MTNTNAEFSGICTSESEVNLLAKQLLLFAGDCRVFLFEGAMGAGKTTLIKALCQNLGSTDSLSSPSYSLVNEYRYPAGKLFHFDLYRLNSEQDLLDFGIEEYLDSGHYCFVEWPEKMLPLIESVYLTIFIRVEKNIRYIRATKVNP
jgi:tRNA threonylcarbamoyladenosine biosynthesis protein TsaE